MEKIEVVHPFTVTLDDGKQKHFQPGTYDVDHGVADHWFTKAHTKQGDQLPDVKHPHEGDSSGVGLTSETPVTDQPNDTGVNERFVGGKSRTVAGDLGGNVMPSSEELGGDDKGSKAKKGL